MNIKNKLKSVSTLRNIWNRINIKKAYRHDEVDFSKYYVEEALKKGDYRYSIMILVHSLEKGMCMEEPRPFGMDKVNVLMGYLKKIDANEHDLFEYKLGISILNSWVKFYEMHNWVQESAYVDVKEFLNNKKSEVNSGCQEYNIVMKDMKKEYFDIISTRRSVRNFKTNKIDMKDIDYAVNCFIQTPTACNRQMCGLMYIEKPELKKMLDESITGLSGFNKSNVQYFVVTYDMSAFTNFTERSQGLLNAGMCVTNFINGLHSAGIGSCCLQWSIKYKRDREVREALGLRKSERIAVVIACGYYNENNIIPCSTRKTNKEVFKLM